MNIDLVAMLMKMVGLALLGGGLVLSAISESQLQEKRNRDFREHIERMDDMTRGNR